MPANNANHTTTGCQDVTGMGRRKHNGTRMTRIGTDFQLIVLSAAIRPIRVL